MHDNVNENNVGNYRINNNKSQNQMKKEEF